MGIARVNTLMRFSRVLAVQGRHVSNRKMSTIDADEVKRYDSYNDNWWDPNGPMKALHAMNSLRIPFIRNGLINTGILGEESKLSPEPFKSLKILDVGCGGGILSIPLARLGGEVTGIDPSSNLLLIAQKKAKEEPKLNGRLEFLVSSIEDHAEKNESKYDVLVTSEVLEHVEKKEEFLSACVSTLKPGGSIFITTINKTLASWLIVIIVAPYILKMLPKDIHEWDKMISPDEVEYLLAGVGCHTRLINGMTYIPLQNKWCWIPVTSVNYALHAVKEQ